MSFFIRLFWRSRKSCTWCCLLLRAHISHSSISFSQTHHKRYFNRIILTHCTIVILFAFIACVTFRCFILIIIFVENQNEWFYCFFAYKKWNSMKHFYHLFCYRSTSRKHLESSHCATWFGAILVIVGYRYCELGVMWNEGKHKQCCVSVLRRCTYTFHIMK